MHDTDKLATERVMRARAELIMTQTFYGVLIGQVTPKLSRNFPTMATNGVTHYYNPDFINGLKVDHLGNETPTQELVLGVQAHENEHDARRHHTRRGGRDPIKWNVATDYAINVDLVDAGFKLPKGALIDVKYRGMSAEDIYRSREIDEALEQQKQQEQAEADEDETEDGLDDADTDPGQNDSDDDGDENEADDDADDQDGEGGDDGQDDDTDEDGEGGNAPGDDDGDDGQPGDGEGAGEPTDGENGDGTGEGPADDGNATGEPGKGEGESGAGDGDAGQPGDGESEPKSAGDPGGMGEVLDAADTPAEVAAEDAKWERNLRQAAMLAAKRGEAPGHVAREVESADHPPQDWRETLRAFFDGGATTRETWSKPNRRFIGGGLYLPGRERDGINRAVIMIDTSGSVTYYPGALEAIKVETQAVLDEGIVDEVVVLYGDTRVTRVDTYRNGDEIEFDPRGGGGTTMKPMFDYVANEVDNPSMIIAFTDLEIEPEAELGPEPTIPVLWAAVGYPENVKRYLAATPWGAPGIEVRPE